VSVFCCALKALLLVLEMMESCRGKEEHRCPAINTLRERQRKKGKKKVSERERERETVFLRRVLAKW